MGLRGRERKPQCLVFQPPSDFDPFYPAAFRQGSVLQSSNVRNPLPPQIPSQFLSSPNEKKKKKRKPGGASFHSWLMFCLDAILFTINILINSLLFLFHQPANIVHNLFLSSTLTVKFANWLSRQMEK